MSGERRLLVRGFPHWLSSADKTSLLLHFGATEIVATPTRGKLVRSAGVSREGCFVFSSEKLCVCHVWFPRAGQEGESASVCVDWQRVYVTSLAYIKVMPGYFLSFETFVLFAQAPDEGN